MTISVGIYWLLAVWFLTWGITAFTGRGKFGNQFLGVLAIIIGVLGLIGRAGIVAW